MPASDVEEYLRECRELTLHELATIIPAGDRCREVLYDLMLEYPLREAKALRPALCVATCRALGGNLESVLRSAATLELYHNAFLIHDDVEDGSEHRRDRPTLHAMHGAPIAVNVGDAMLALALQPLLDNMRLIGMGKALRILDVIARMARESTEGQAIELHWIRDGEWRLGDADYVRMVYKKTSWYTFIAPMLIGAIVAGAAHERLTALRKFAALLGIAFQIQDDVLNLVGEGGKYGKEIAGDLWEGKRTLILTHALRTACADERGSAERILAKPRPPKALPDGEGSPAGGSDGALAALREVCRALKARGDLTEAGERAIADVVGAGAPGQNVKTGAEIEWLLSLVRRQGSIDYAREVGARYAARARRALEGAHWMPPSVHRDLLENLVDFVVTRER
ncbi:MAG TPA: polyprenyl synthetase family protein [Candidatus Binatia bacterium]|nr:polyprenyl synthetase family protein [Candidatus Binatia bacterium]